MFAEQSCLTIPRHESLLIVKFRKAVAMDALLGTLLRPYRLELTVPRERATSKWKLKVTGEKPALRVTAPDRLPGCDK